MPKKRTGIYQRPNGTWMAQRELGRDKLSGKRKRVTTYGKTAAEAQEKLDKALSDIRTQTYIADRNVTVEMWFTHWLSEYAKPKVKHSTYISYRGYINKRIVPILGHLKLLDLSVDILQRFIREQYLHGNLKTGGELSEKTVRNIYLMIHAVLAQAVKNELVIKNVAESVVLPKVKHREIVVLTKREQYNLIVAAQNSERRYSLGILLALKTGMRIGEICGLRWQDIDEWDRVIHVRQTLQRQETVEQIEGGAKTEIVIGSPKSENGRRDIPLPSSLIPYLKRQKEMQIQDEVTVGSVYQDKGYVLMNEIGYYTEPRTLQDTFKALLKEAGIERKINFHALRHTFATRAVEENIDYKTLSEFMGHSSVSTTMNLYAHSLDERKRSLMDKMDKIFD